MPEVPDHSQDLRDLRSAKVRLLDRPLGLYDVVRDQDGRRGRRHFPALLCLTACRSVGGESSQVLPAAIALDLVESAFTLHDSLGTVKLKPSLQRWGKPQAINAGDALFSLARLSVLDLENTGAGPARISDALGLLDEVCLRAGRSRSMALDMRGRQQGAAQAISIAQERVGALWGCAVRMGAMLAGASHGLETQLANFGVKLGTAYALAGSSRGDYREEARDVYTVALAYLEASLSTERQEELRELAALAVGGRTSTLP